jgi:hypothetical protein
VIKVAGEVARITILNLAGRMGEAVPDGLSLAVFVPCSFYLVGSTGGAPEKVRRKNLCNLMLFNMK